MTAKEMFEELGYSYKKIGNILVYKHPKFSFYFDISKKDFLHEDGCSITIKEYHAITQQMRELGWIE